MKFLSLSLHNYRNILSCSLDIHKRHVIFRGENGQGKTNLLESLYISCYGFSFRTRKTNHLITHGKNYASISVRLQEGETAHTIEVKILPGSLSISIDGKEIKDRKELIESFPCIIFSHGDIEFVKGAPSERRKFFDQTMCLYDSLFFDDIRRYNRILRQRNQALKDQMVYLVPSYDSQLAQLGMIIQSRRSQVVEEFNELFPQVFSRVSGMTDPPVIDYSPSWKHFSNQQEVKEFLQKNLNQDLKFFTTTTGPHRDKFTCIKNGKNFIETASTGQLRLISLVLRAAQAQYYQKKTGRKPVLLLDDVLLELDHAKRSAFLHELAGYEQAVCTFLPNETYGEESLFTECYTYQIHEGEIVYEKSF